MNLILFKFKYHFNNSLAILQISDIGKYIIKQNKLRKIYY